MLPNVFHTRSIRRRVNAPGKFLGPLSGRILINLLRSKPPAGVVFPIEELAAAGVHHLEAPAIWCGLMLDDADAVGHWSCLQGQR